MAPASALSGTVVAASRNRQLLLNHIPSHAMQWPCNENPALLLGGFWCISTYFTCPCCLGMFGGNGAKRLCEPTNPYWNMQVRSDKHDGASKLSARVRLPDGIHQLFLTHIGLVCMMQIRSEKRHGAIKILALGMQVRPPDGLWAVMRDRLRTQEKYPSLAGQSGSCR